MWDCLDKAKSCYNETASSSVQVATMSSILLLLFLTRTTTSAQPVVEILYMLHMVYYTLYSSSSVTEVEHESGICTDQ